MENDSVIEVSHLTVSRDRPILDDISWRVASGENWVILGPNGSGKTALLRSITGYFTPTRGTISICGNSEDEPWNELRKLIGFVSSSVAQRIEDAEEAIDTVISGRYAMINYWSQSTKRDDRERAREVLAWIECSHLEKQPWGKLSQGERQRILIGRALMAEDLRILILDEPCAGLDPVARQGFLAFLERFATSKYRKRKTAILFVTHHVEEIIPLFTHVLLLSQGRIVAAGTKSNCLNSDTLSHAFQSEVELRQDNDSYSLAVRPDRTGFR